MSEQTTGVEQQREVERQVDAMLARSASFHALPAAEQASIRQNTTEIIKTLAQNRMTQGGDPFAVPQNITGVTGPPLPGQRGGGPQQGGGRIDPSQFTGGARDPRNGFQGPQSARDFGAGIATGIQQTGQLLREVNFPAFVAELIQGVFQAVVDASIQQMKAYGELVQSVTMSLNDFRDQNVTANQGRDHLVSKFPTLMQINVTNAGPRVGLRPGAGSMDLPDFRSELGIDEDIFDLDEETIEEKLVPAARNDLARSRQSLLATMLLMGINRIIVTDGRINARMRFDFRARDSQTTLAQEYDYGDFGEMTIRQSERESSLTTGESYRESRGGRWFGPTRSGESERWSRGTDQITTAPIIYLTKDVTSYTEAEVAAEGQLRSDVSLNFRSETFDLNQLASADEIFRLERVRAAGRGVPAAAAPAGTQLAPTETPATGSPAPAATS